MRLTRIARSGDPRIAPGVSRFLVEAQIATWRDEVVKSGREYLRAWAKTNGISERNVEIAAKYEELARVIETSEMATQQERQAQVELQQLRQEQSETTRTERGGELELQIADLQRQMDGSELQRKAVIADLRQLRAVSSLRELESLTSTELRNRALEIVERNHPKYDECLVLLKVLGDWHARFGYGDEFAVAAMLRSDVVAATCVGLHAFRGMENIQFDLCIVDEASRATIPEILIPMVQAKRWILVGDPRQLPPFVEDALRDDDLLREYELTEHDVRATIFDRLRERLPASCVATLSLQHRMVPAIGDLISHCFYDDHLKSAPQAHAPWLRLATGQQPVVWYTTSDAANRFERKFGTSYTNQFEARVIRNLLGRLNFCAAHSGVSPKVSILTGYTAQRDVIEREIAGDLASWTALRIECSSVDAYQGRQADVTIYSVTRSNRDHVLGFLADPSRLNVALSRGRSALILVGDHRFARSADESFNPFRCVVDYIERHPNDCTIVPANG